MADISFLERNKFESFFGMKSGYVLDFTDRSLQDFVANILEKDIQDIKYFQNSGSKANRLRAFITQESNHEVGLLLEKLIEYKMDKYKTSDIIDENTLELYESCSKIAAKLKEGGLIEHLDALMPNNDDKDFKLLAKSIRESIEKNEPEAALDRLHTFYFKFVRELCDSHSIKYEKTESLNAIFGKYVKYLIENKLIESEMSEIS